MGITLAIPAHEPAVSPEGSWEGVPVWHVLNVYPSRERFVISNIKARYPGIEAWAPMERASELKSRRVFASDLVERAFFPGYCFVEQGAAAFLVDRGVPKVLSVLKFGPVAAEVTAEEMRGMRALCSMPRVERITIPEVGKRYRLLVGKAEVEGVLEQAGRRFYVWVAGLMQGMRVQVDLKVDRLIPA